MKTKKPSSLFNIPFIIQMEMIYDWVNKNPTFMDDMLFNGDTELHDMLIKKANFYKKYYAGN